MRKCGLIFGLLVITIGLNGCGKSVCEMCGEEKQCKVYDSLLFEEMELCEECVEEVRTSYLDEKDVLTAPEPSKEEPVVKEETVKNEDNEIEKKPVQEKKKFDKSIEWGKYIISHQAIQIEDTVYAPGVFVDDFITTVESSEIEYSYDYLPGELVCGKESKTIIVYRDTEKWFEANAINVSDKTIALSECIIDRIKTYEAAQEYCYIMDGRTYDELLSLSYTEVKALAEEVFPFYELTEETVEANGKDLILLNYDGSKDGILVNAKRVTGYLIKSGFNLCFYIDKTTSQVVDFEYKHWNGSMWVECPPSVVAYFKDMTEDEYNSLVAETQEQVQNKYVCEEVTVVGSCFKQNGGWSFYNDMDDGVILYPYDLCTVFELKKADGTVSYVNGQINKLVRKITGEMEYHSIEVGDEKGSIDDVVMKHKLTKDISDTTLY
ncbi:MAG: hypothetical protein IKT67_11215 [Lachnospiraceae bacterium]|nr:hypothetical protein [Lachnospiraceae bacterium]